MSTRNLLGIPQFGTVGAIYTAPTAQTLNASGWRQLNFTSREYDSHGAATSLSPFTFTAPFDGIYTASCHLVTGNVSFSAGEFILLALWKNDVEVRELFSVTAETTQSLPRRIQGTGAVYLNAGDRLDLRVFSSQGLTTEANSLLCWVSITHVPAKAP
jgi:hypothetical protein